MAARFPEDADPPDPSHLTVPTPQPELPDRSHSTSSHASGCPASSHNPEDFTLHRGVDNRSASTQHQDQSGDTEGSSLPHDNQDPHKSPSAGTGIAGSGRARAGRPSVDHGMPNEEWVEDDAFSQASDYTHLSVAIGSDLGECALFHVVLRPGWGPRVSPHLMCQDDSAAADDISASLVQLQTTTNENVSARIMQDLIIRKIPKSAEMHNFCELLQCMMVNKNDIKEEAIAALESTILRFKQFTVNTNYIEQLRQVASDTQTAFLRVSHHDSQPAFHNEVIPASQLHVYLHLHLMSLSFLLSVRERGHVDILSPFITTLKIANKKRRDLSEQKRNAVDVLRMFYESVNDPSRLIKRPPNWISLDWGRKGNLERTEFFRFVSVGQHVVYVYSVLNEISNEAWSLLGRTLLLGLQDLYKTFPRTGKYKRCAEVVDFVLVRCLCIFLRNLFTRDRSPVGKDNRDHNGLISNMILEIIQKTTDPSHKELLVQEVRHLPFHNAQVVRQIFNCCLSGKIKESPIEFYKRAVVGYMEKTLNLVNFQRDRTGSTERGAGETQEECSWVEIICSVGNMPAEGVVYVPKPSCLGRSADEMFRCVSDHPGNTKASRPQKVKSRHHCKNLDNLILLSLGCKNIIQLLAYQIQPFPFYITEVIEHRRLLEYLIEHRCERRSISAAVLVQVIRDVIQALSYMLRRKMVMGNVTAYSMIVDLHDTTRISHRESAICSLSVDNFAIKVADLSSVLKQRSDTSKEIEGIQFPLRWTSPEMLLKGSYSEKSMVYGLAFLMFECWTHGCQPFTFYDNKNMSTADILLSFFKNIPRGTETPVHVRHWPCFPEEMYRLIERCTQLEPDRRPSLLEVDRELQTISICEESDGEMEPELESAIWWNRKYPPLSTSQQNRRHVPEMGTAFSLNV